MATQAEIKAERKEKERLKKQAKLDKAAKKKKDLADVVEKATTAKEKRKIRAQRKKALKGDLYGETALAESRTARARGYDSRADERLKTAERLKGNKQMSEAKVARIKKLANMRRNKAKPSERLKESQKPIIDMSGKKKSPVVKKPVVKKAKSTDPNRGNKVPGASSSEYMTRTPRPDFNATKVKKADRGKGLLTDKTIRNRAKKDSRSTMQKLFGASEEKRAMGRNQMNRARSSMGMKKGGMVKKCKMDGIAIRGKTRAKERSK
jgi:hypothetical protein